VGGRFFFNNLSVLIWPFLGAGYAKQVEFLNVSEGTPEYLGQKTAFFANVGLMIPLVDLGIKAEFRANFYGSDRLMLTTGVGAVLFL
jgi:hypothetical protein